MKKVFIVSLILMSIVAKPSFAITNMGATIYNNQKILKEEDSFENVSSMIIRRMENTLLSMPVVNNVNLNFLNEMIALHSEEIQLSTAIQGYVNNPQVIQYANDLLAAENGELREMRIIRTQLAKEKDQKTSGNDNYLKAAKEQAKNRFKRFEDYKVSGNPEKDYLNIMKINNEADIDLSKDYLKYGDNEIVKRIAQNIINVKTNQNKEADIMLSAIK